MSEDQQRVVETEPEQEAPPDPAEQLAATEDRLKRAFADLDNYRKRSVKETERRVEEARDRVLLDWLDAIDSVERALVIVPDDPGLRAVLEQMEAILERYGVARTGLTGERFDPERHEAISVRDTDEVPDRTIVDQARSGWMRGDRVLRPAQVVVARQD